jgi:hypothetical protein
MFKAFIIAVLCVLLITSFVKAEEKSESFNRCGACKLKCMRTALRTRSEAGRLFTSCSKQCIQKYCSSTTTATTNESTTKKNFLKKLRAKLSSGEQKPQQQEGALADVADELESENTFHIHHHYAALDDMSEEQSSTQSDESFNCEKCKTSCGRSTLKKKSSLCLAKCAQSSACKYEDNLAFSAQ